MSKYLAIGNSEPTPDDLPDEIKKIINDGKKKAGFNPDGTPISNPTDTNQASEDDLAQQIETITQAMFVTLSEWQAGAPIDWHSAKVKGRADLLELIRTEKLKLLAEVRERAIPNPTTPAGENEFVSLDELTKLEAEL